MRLKVRLLHSALASQFLVFYNKFHDDSKSAKFIVVGLLFVLMCINAVNAATITVTGNTNWSALTGGSGIGGLPNNTDILIVRGGATLTVNVTNAACASLQLGGTTANGAGTLTFSGTNPYLTVSGTVQVGGWGNANRNGTITFTNTATLQAVSVSIGGTGTTPASGAITMTAGGTLMTAGLSSHNAGDAFTEGAGTVQLTATNILATTDTGAEFTGFNNLVIAGGTTTLPRAIVLTGSLTINNGAALNTGNFQISLGGDFHNSGTFTAGSSPISLINAIAVQSIDGFTTTGAVSMTKTGGVATFMGSVSAGALTINGNGGTLNLGTGFTHIFGGLITLTAGTLNGGSSTMNVNLVAAPAWTNTAGVFTANAGTVNFGGSGNQSITGTLATTFNNLTLSGTGVKTLTTVPTINGILSMEGQATAFGTPNYGTAATLQYQGSAIQTTGSEFPATFNGTGGVNINNSNGVILGAARTIGIASDLTFVSGTLTTTTNLLSVTNTSSSAINGATATSFINGPLSWSLIPGTYIFPVGKGTTFLPFSITNPSTTNTAKIEAFITAPPGGTADGTTLTTISTTGYWALTTAGNFSTSSISLSQPTIITPLNSIGGSASVGGTYTCLSGLAGTNGVSNSDVIGTNKYFLFAAGAPKITTTTPTALNDFSYAVGFGPSQQLRYFTVKGVYLTTNISVLPTDTFEISLKSGAQFAPQSLISLLVVNGTVSLDTIYVRMKAGLALGNINPIASHTINCSSDNATTKTIYCNGVVTNAGSITLGTTTLNGFGYNVGSGTSTAQSFTVSGTYLTSNIIITAPTDYEICLTLGGTYSSTIPLTPSGGSVTSIPIYVRLKLGLSVGQYNNENVVLTATNTLTQNVTCSGSVNSPTLSLSTFTLGGFIYNQGIGVTSSVQSFTVTGTNLSNNITLTAPTDFEISTGSTFGTTILLTQLNGNVATTTINVRMKAGLSGVGSPTYGPENIVITSSGAISQNVACSGQVVPATTAASISSNNNLVGFVYTFGNGPSVTQSFTVSGTSLGLNNINVTPPANFEICLTSNGTFVATSLSIVPTGGFVNATPVYIRLMAGKAIGSYNGSATLTATGAVTQYVACNGSVIAAPTITAGPANLDQTCPGSNITLSSTGTNITNLYWTGPNGFYSTISNPPLGVVTSANNGTYTVTGNTLSTVNLLTNGDFEQQNTGFGSSYQYVAPSPTALSSGGTNGATGGEGNYTFTGSATYPTAQSVHSGFSPCTAEHGSYQMVVNGATSNGIITWSESISVTPNTNYQFSYWVQSVVSLNPAQLQLYVNGIPAGSLNTASGTTCVWTNFVNNINSGSNTVLQLTLINKNIIANGNDFALDNLELKQVFSVSSSVNLVVNQTLPVSVIVTPSANNVFKNTPVTFTATPTNGGTAPLYQWKVNGQSVIGATSSTYTYSPNDKDSVSCVLTSNYPCTTGNPATNYVKMIVKVRTNYWIGRVDTDWAKIKNWTGNFVPLAGDDVEYATTLNYKVDSSAVNDLYLDQNRTIGSLINTTTKRLVIPPAKGLIINNYTSTGGNADRIYIQSGSASPNGSLIFSQPTLNQSVNATVEMKALGQYNATGYTYNSNIYHYTWQYFGVPLTSVLVDTVFAGSYVRQYDESKTVQFGKWTQLAMGATLSPFKAYELTQNSPKTIVFKGKLVNNSTTIPITYTVGAADPGQNILANPYTAAISIAQLQPDANTEQTVYLYNTGAFGQWGNNGGSTIVSGGNMTTPGVYQSVPFNTAGYPGIPVDIPSMQGFLIKTKSTTAGSLTITYSSVIINNISKQRAPKKKEVSDKSYLKVTLQGNNSFDNLWLIKAEGTTKDFDNGWDGYKILPTVNMTQIFAIENCGNLQVNASTDINNTTIGLVSGGDLQDTLIFTNENLKASYQGIYLVDLVENKTIDITEDSTTYIFNPGNSNEPSKRFKVVARYYEKNSKDETSNIKLFSSHGSVFVQNLSNLKGNVLLYDIVGHYIKDVSFGPNGVISISGLMPGAYIAKANNGIEQVTKRLIVN